MTTEPLDALRLRDAPARGLTRASLRTGAWTGVSHGLYQRSELAADETARLRALSEVLPPPGAWSHYTGARLLRLWLPPLPDGLPSFATVPPGMTRPERDGLYVARSRAAGSNRCEWTVSTCCPHRCSSASWQRTAPCWT